jgi:hypothetical protein
MDTDDKARERRAAVREAAGVILIGVGILGALGYLVAFGGLGVTFAALAGVALAALGRRLASGTATETGSGTEGDFEPIGPGPLWQDPEDPQSFIPRR